MTKTPYSDINAPYGNPESKEPYNGSGVPYAIFQGGVNVLEAVSDPTMSIQGYDVSISGLEYTYQETGRTNDTDAVLYFGISYTSFVNPREWVLSPNSVAYPSLPPTFTASFTNPDPSPNPIPTATNVVSHPQLADPRFYACLWNPITNTISTLYKNFNDLSVGDDYLEGTLSQKSFNTSTNEITLQFKVDTTHNASWFNIDTSTALFDYLTTKIDTTPSVSGDYGYSYVTNASAGGHTPPFDARYSVDLTDGVPNYNAGNFVIWEWTARVLEYGNLSDYVGNPVFSLTTSTGSTYASSLPGVITDSVVPWIGIDSFSVTETQATIVKSYAEWTNEYLFKHTHGGTTNTYQILGGATTIDFSTLSPPITPSNNDTFEIIQPINGDVLSITFQKDFTIAYTGTPPADWSVTATSVGINFPYTIDIEDPNTNTKLDHLEMTQATEVFDIRNLPLETDPHGHTHIDWYGYGLVDFVHSGIIKSFDASYIQDGDGTNLSGGEIVGFNAITTSILYGYRLSISYSSINFHDAITYPPLFNDYDTGTSVSKADLVSAGNTTDIDKIFVDSDFETTPLSVETPIPILNRDVKAVLYDTTAYSVLYSDTSTFDVGDTRLKAFISSAVFSAGYVALTLVVNTAQNLVWRQLFDALIRADYNTTNLDLGGFTGSVTNGYDDTAYGSVSSSTPPYDKHFFITHSVDGLAGGDFEVGQILFRILNDTTEADITTLNLTNVGDNVGLNWLNDFDITQNQTFSITAQKIDSFIYTQTTIEITKNVTDAFDWSYRIAGGSIVNVTGESGLTQSVSVSLSDGQLIEVFQPYFAGATLTDTTTGLGISRNLLATFDGATFPSGNDIDPTGGTAGLIYIQSTQYEVPTRSLGDYSAVAGTMTIANVSELNNMGTASGRAISMWFKYTGTGDKALFTTSSYGTQGQGVKVEVTDLGLNGLGFRVSSSLNNNKFWTNTTPTTNANEWHHIILAINNSTATLVLNGDYRGIPSGTGTFDLSNWVSGQSITLGDVAGFIDHFTFYSGVPTGMATSPISGEAATYYAEDTIIPAPDIRATFETTTHGTATDDIVDTTAMSPYPTTTPPVGIGAKFGSKVGDITGANFIQQPNCPTIDSYITLAFWFNFSDSGTRYQNLFGSQQYSPSLGGYGGYYENVAKQIQLWYSYSGNMFKAPFFPVANTWYHIVFRIEGIGNNCELYIDGQEVVNVVNSPTTTLNINPGQFLNIGVANEVQSDTDQYMDDVRIYNSSNYLSASEVRILYNSY